MVFWIMTIGGILGGISTLAFFLFLGKYENKK